MSVVTDHLTFFRTRWATRLVDTCTINRRAAGTLNTTTGVITAGGDTAKYSGDCLIRPASRSQRDYGQEQIGIVLYEVRVPYTVTGIEPDDQVILGTVNYDAELQGETLRVVSVEGDSYNTIRLLICAHNLGGGSSA